MMKKILLFLPLVAAVTLTAACSGSAVNQGPELRGVTDIDCLVNTRVDLLEGVAALDTEDGDITPDLQITITPEVKVEGGFATFTEVGDYEVLYEVRDSEGKLARTTATAIVSEREVYLSSVLTNGFSLDIGGSAKTLSEGLNGDEYSFKVSGGEIAEDIKLTRTYTLITGVEYEFKYVFSSSVAGKIKAAANGSAIAERYITVGDNEVTFTHKLPRRQTSDGATASENVEVELWLGELEGDIECSLSRAETQYFKQGDGYTELAQNFSFNGNIINRDGNAHAVYASADGKSATLEVTDPTDAMWKVGMFVNTGIRMSAGDEYVVSMDIESELDNPFELCIQHDQWQDSDAVIVQSPKGHTGRTITASGAWSGNLWLFIRSGTHENKITVSNFSVQVKEGGYKNEYYAISGFTTNNYDGGAGSVKCEYGKVIYSAESFGYSWGNNEIGSPAFEISGAADNYVVTFTAKASKPLNVVFVATYADYWDTFVWKQLKFTTEEQTFSVNCDNKNIDGLYRFIWQFGNADNALYRDVTVEISDIKICLKSELEG